MRRSVVVLVASFAFSSVVFASQPGQPLDCSDWVFHLPGLSCSYLGEHPCPPDTPPEGYCGGSQETVFDNERYLYWFRRAPLGQYCGTFHSMHRTGLWRTRDGISNELVAHVDDRCVESSKADILDNERTRAFDPVQGQLIAFFTSKCISSDGNSGCYRELPGGYAAWAAIFDGFPTLFDILHTYLPSNVVLFRVPYMPEGLAAADRFDTYWGNVTRPLDFSRAHPLQCAYPDHAPQFGESLTFPNSAPTPAPGQAIYYLTSVTYQGQTRAGRKALEGRLSGRDASALPECAVESGRGR